MEKKIIKIISNILKVSENKILNNECIYDYPSWDSLQHLNLILDLEKEFNTTFSSEEIVEMKDYKSIKLEFQWSDLLI